MGSVFPGEIAGGGDGGGIVSDVIVARERWWSGQAEGQPWPARRQAPAASHEPAASCGGFRCKGVVPAGLDIYYR